VEATEEVVEEIVVDLEDPAEEVEGVADPVLEATETSIKDPQVKLLVRLRPIIISHSALTLSAWVFLH
jgi:hypothetical protein